MFSKQTVKGSFLMNQDKVQTILKLLKPITSKNHVIYTSDYFTCPEVAKTLLNMG